MNRSIVLLLVAALWAVPAYSQAPSEPVSERVPVTLALEDALQIALERNYTVRNAALDVANARAQVREAWGQVLPSVNANASYTRNVVQANPFAGSDAGGLFSGLAALDWLSFNERARTDGDAATEPISLEEFRRRQAEGYTEAGVSLTSSDNPFAVPNQFITQLSISQTIYNGSAFAAIRGARSLQEINAAALTQQQQQTVHQVRQLFYGALLTQQQAEVARASVTRAQSTQSETARRVAAGTLPLLERLSAEVEVSNLQTQFVQVDNQAALARTNLLFVLGVPVDQPVVLRGALDLPQAAFVETVSLDDAVAVALERRPELEQARLVVELQQVNRNITRAAYRPNVSAFANLGLQGSVPDNRTAVQQGLGEGDPFRVTVNERGFFDTAYWNPNVAVGAQLTWNLFDGFQTSYRVQQNTIEVQRAELQLEQATQGVILEVEQALRNLASSRQRIVAQAENVQTAETAFEFASSRLSTGVATQIDVRFASSQLDQARLAYLQAAYDYLVARSDLERAVGVVLPEPIGTSPSLFTAVD